MPPCKTAEENRRYVKAHYERNKAWINSFKERPCMDCGGEFPTECMDFDHVRGKKVTNLSLMHGMAKHKVEAEIAKCDVICANCHRQRTRARQRGES